MVRKSPKLSATLFPIKTRRFGIDKNIWEVKKFKNGKRWALSEDQTPIKVKKLKAITGAQTDNIKGILFV